MASQYIIQGIFALAGILSLLAALLDWDWFFTARNAQFVVRNVGRRQARWFYGVLGAAKKSFIKAVHSLASTPLVTSVLGCRA